MAIVQVEHINKTYNTYYKENRKFCSLIFYTRFSKNI